MNGPLSSEQPATDSRVAPPALSSVLQRITAFILCAVMLSLAWILLAASEPRVLRLSSIEAEIVLVLALLLTALLLVSAVALQHTRSAEREKE
jgi:preprotein translocase subunit SecG